MGKKDKETEISRTELSAQINAELEKAIDDLTLFDDDLMSKVFDGNIEAAELLLKIVLERDDIKVKRVKGQVELKSAYPGGRNIRLDIAAVDENGVHLHGEDALAADDAAGRVGERRVQGNDVSLFK